MRALYLFLAMIMVAQAAYALAPGDFKGQSALIVFWREDCPPCLHELEILPKIAKTYPELPIVTITLNDKVQTTAFGDTKHTLPYSVMLHADGSLCKNHYGILGSDLVKEWLKTC